MEENTNPVGYSTAVIKKINDKVNEKLNLEIKEVSPLKNINIVETKSVVNPVEDSGMSWFQIIFIIVIIICVVYLLYKYFFKSSSYVTIEKSDSVDDEDDASEEE